MKMIAPGPARAAGRLTAEALAALLAEDVWNPPRGPARTTGGVRRPMVAAEREGLEALPAGHAVSWSALWPGQAVPGFPGLRPFGAVEGAEDRLV